jgi:exodeoxyribonuclease VII large subunit
MSGEPQAITVSQFVDLANDYLSGFREVVIQGEVSNYRPMRDRQLHFFELKDDTSRVLCFAIGHQMTVEVKDGMEVRVLGEPSLFKKSGQFHVRVKAVELVGEGALQLALDKLKKQLEKEGLFRPERKRALPRFPHTIGLITSPDAAAYSDVLRVAQNRWPVKIKFFPCQVQGIRATKSIVRALEAASEDADVEAIILTRGGGSLEDLQAFNSEDVARAVFGARIPVVCGVGHERDVTIADLVADVRASTPSNASEKLLPDHKKVLAEIDGLQRRVTNTFDSILLTHNRSVTDLFSRLDHGLRARLADFSALVSRFFAGTGRVSERLAQQRQLITLMHQRLIRAQQLHLSSRGEKINALTRVLQTLSPRATLNRGYSIVFKEGHVLKSTQQLAKGEQVRVRLANGRFSSTVNDITND